MPVPPIAVNLLKIFGDSDVVAQSITGLLCVFSVIAWAVMWGKNRELKELRRVNHAFEAAVRNEQSVLDKPDAARRQASIPYAALFADAVEAYWRAAAIGNERGEQNHRARLEHAENALQRALGSQILRYESNMVFLASIVSGAPFMGLLGTVWGVMTAFADVAVTGSASLATLAPGVSGALLTTIAGLLVAIPSVFGYNFLFSNVKRMITEIENYASSLADRIELESK